MQPLVCLMLSFQCRRKMFPSTEQTIQCENTYIQSLSAHLLHGSGHTSQTKLKSLF